MLVNFNFYKASGKWYSEAWENVEGETFYDVVGATRNMLARGKRPGLVDGHDMHCHVTVYTLDGPLTFLYT